jgi:hypothetical protein
MAPHLYLIVALGAVAIYVFLTITKKLHSSKYKLPPRVPGVPVFGNSFQVPLTQQGPWAKKLAETYGEM